MVERPNSQVHAFACIIVDATVQLIFFATPTRQSSSVTAVLVTTSMQSSNLVIQIHPSDNAIVATRDLAAGTSLDEPCQITLRQSVPMGHKIAISQIDEGDRILKYGQPIGVASEVILPGDWIPHP